MHMGPHPIVTAVSHNVGMLLRLSLYGVGACVCPQKIVQSVLTPQQMESVWLFPLGVETVGRIQFGYQAQSCQWSVIEEFILCAKAVYADDLLFISDSNLTILWTAASKYSIIIS